MKKIKIPSKLDADATDVPMGLKKTPKNQEKKNENVVHDDQHATAQKKSFCTWK